MTVVCFQTLHINCRIAIVDEVLDNCLCNLCVSTYHSVLEQSIHHMSCCATHEVMLYSQALNFIDSTISLLFVSEKRAKPKYIAKAEIYVPFNN